MSWKQKSLPTHAQTNKRKEKQDIFPSHLFVRNVDMLKKRFKCVIPLHMQEKQRYAFVCLQK